MTTDCKQAHQDLYHSCLEHSTHLNLVSPCLLLCFIDDVKDLPVCKQHNFLTIYLEVEGYVMEKSIKFTKSTVKISEA